MTLYKCAAVNSSAKQGPELNDTNILSDDNAAYEVNVDNDIDKNNSF